MEFLSHKDKMNVATPIIEKCSSDLFMTMSNQILLSKRIYQLHRNNHGILGYLYFKKIVPIKMQQWITTFNIPKKSTSTDILYFLNEIFIKKSQNLYEFKTRDNIKPVIDTNVYKSQISLSRCNNNSDSDNDNDNDDNANDKIVTVTKMSNELLASDYGLIDVWKDQSVIATSSNFRYNNEIPFWQKTMNIRHYDRANMGFHANVERSSINTNIYGYGDAQKELIKKKEKQYAKNKSLPYDIKKNYEISESDIEYFS
jgi:hypothetical protein